MPRFFNKDGQDIKGLLLGILLRKHKDGARYAMRRSRCSFHGLPSVFQHEEPFSQSFKLSLGASGSNPTFESFALQLRECAYAKSLLDGMLLHNQITNLGLDQNTLFQNLALQMYCSCGAVRDALHLLATTRRPNLHSWNAVIRACGIYGLCKDMFQLFDQMQQEGMMPDTHIFVSLLSACTDENAFFQGKYIHAHIISGTANAVLGSVLVNMYSKWGSFKSARQAFHDICESDVVSWTTMISVCVEHHQFMDALQLFNQMQIEAIIPNKITIVSTLNACAKIVALKEGKKLHAIIVCSDVEIDNIVGNAIVAMYSQCGSLADAQRIFDEVCDRDVISWTSLMSSCVHDKQGKHAFLLLQQMQCEGVLPDEVIYVTVFIALGNEVALAEAKQLHACMVGSGFLAFPVVVNSLITTYGKCSNMKDAKIIFNSLMSPNVVSWTAMISAYVRCGEGKEVIHVFQQMLQEGTMPFKFSFVGVLHACAHEALLAMGKRVHASVMGSDYSSDVVLGTALVHMYGKSGSLRRAESTFEHIVERDTILWNAMIAAYAHNGQDKDALRLYHQMLRDGVMPSKVTFMSMLSAFGHAGLVDNGYCSFVLADVLYGIVPARDHYNCVLSLLSRAGLLYGAEGVMKKMPFWLTLETATTPVGICRDCNHVDQGDFSTRRKLVKLDAKEIAWDFIS